MVESINSSLLTIYFHEKAKKEKEVYGIPSPYTRRLAEGTITLEQILLIVITICSFY